MKYTLADGTKFNLNDIDEVSEIKDYGTDPKHIMESTLAFSVRLRNGKTVRVSHNYQYNDWFDVMKELKSIRNDIIKKREQLKTDKS